MTLINHNHHTSRILSIIIALTLFVNSQTSHSKEQSQQPPRSFALLIGISDYYQLGRRPWPKLNTGQELDTLREILISKWGFSSDDILTLKDNSATKQNIISSFRHHLIDKAKPGDIVFFHFSGHGQQIPDDNDDEMDGLDESLVPYDAIDRSVAAGAKTNIRDDELGILFRELAERLQAGTRSPGSITVSLDSCFSGTATRGILIERGGPWDVSLDAVSYTHLESTCPAKSWKRSTSKMQSGCSGSPRQRRRCPNKSWGPRQRSMIYKRPNSWRLR